MIRLRTGMDQFNRENTAQQVRSSLVLSAVIAALCILAALVYGGGLGTVSAGAWQQSADDDREESDEPDQESAAGADERDTDKESDDDTDKESDDDGDDEDNNKKSKVQKQQPGDEDEEDGDQGANGKQERAVENPFPRRVKAPDFGDDITWLNTKGSIDQQSLRGKFVLLDFWTYCCINCMHILPELKKLEEKYPNQLVVIGVHSAKFLTEEDTKNISEAILRYEIRHPVINDSKHAVWDRYAVSSWPSLRVIDPEGYLIAGHSGEITFEDLDQFFQAAIPYYRDKGLLDESPVRFDLEEFRTTATPLRFPGKILADEAGDRLFIADSNHNRIVVTKLSGELIEIIGDGGIGTKDGGYAEAQFNKPQGMALFEETLYVADTENHLLRKVDLKEKNVKTIAGLGEQWRGPWPGMIFDEKTGYDVPERFVGPPLKTGLNSPWDVLVHEGALYIAMAGPHQIWKMPLDESEIGPYAGNGREDIVDGELLPREPYAAGFSSFAQPSGLATDGKWLYVADSEGSSVRGVPLDGKAEVRTIVGTSHLSQNRLFHFGDKDGKGRDVLLQHCLGLAFHNGALYLADTYNNKIKVIDPAERTSQTIAGSGEAGHADDPATFDEPAGLAYAAGKLYVADTNNHLIRVIDLKDHNRVSTLEIPGLSPPERQDSSESTNESTTEESEPIAAELPTLKPSQGKAALRVQLQLPDGYKINDLAPMIYRIKLKGDAGPLDQEALVKAVRVNPPASEFEVSIPVREESGEASIILAVVYYYCQEGGEGLCKVGTVSWKLDLKVDPSSTEDAPTLQYTVP